MECFAFVRGLLPGILIGLFSSVLIFALWRNSVVMEQPIELSAVDRANIKGVNIAERVGAAGRRRKVRGSREVDSAGAGRHLCNGTHHLKTQPVPRGRHLLLLMIFSRPPATEERNAVRATWLRYCKNQDKYVFKFVVGTATLKPENMQKLACENQQYGDLLLLSDVDEPENSQNWSSSQKLLGAFLWALENVNFAYIFKTNDATFVVLDPIIKELEEREKGVPETDLLWGFFAGGVQATKEGRFAEKNWFLCTHYLPYPQGGGYVISHGLVSMLGTLSSDLQPYSHDDIALGVWLSPFDGIDKKHDVRFNTGYSSRGCNNAYLVTSRETSKSMFQKYSHFKKTGLLCEEEQSLRLSYVYNWTAPPNRCCVRQSGIP